MKYHRPQSVDYSDATYYRCILIVCGFATYAETCRGVVAKVGSRTCLGRSNGKAQPCSTSRGTADGRPGTKDPPTAVGGIW
jgi:hypothetical protein